MPRRTFNKQFYLAILIAGILAIITGFFILINGKLGSFQIINGNHNSFFDQIFKYYTIAGDGIIWSVLGLYCIFFRREYFIAVIAGFLISTLLTQFLKRVVYPDELRPITFLSENFHVHVIEGVRMKRVHSFPSGHTGTAFTMSLLITNIIKKQAWVIFLVLLAFLAGYSRVYLGQHFLTDVLGGMVVGTASSVLAVFIYQKFEKEKSTKTN